MKPCTLLHTSSSSLFHAIGPTLLAATASPLHSEMSVLHRIHPWERCRSKNRTRPEEDRTGMNMAKTYSY